MPDGWKLTEMRLMHWSQRYHGVLSVLIFLVVIRCIYLDILGSKGGTLTRALASRPSGQGSSPTSSATCGCSFLLLFPVLLHGFYHAPLVFFGVKNSAFKTPLPLGISRCRTFLWRCHSEIISIFCIMLDPFAVCYYFRLLFKQSSCLPLQTDKVDRLEADNQRFKEKLRDLDYYKKRAEVNSVIYMEELCSIVHCKENYVNVHNFTHITWMKVR